MHTLTIAGPLGTATEVESSDRKSASLLSISGSYQGRSATSFVGSRVTAVIAVTLASVRCTPPRRLQSTVRDGRSPGLRVVAISRLPGTFPVALAWGSPLTVAGAAPEVSALAPASLFPSRSGGPSRATLPAG